MPGAVIAAGIVAYLGSFKGAFLLDDVLSIVANPSIRRFALALSSWPAAYACGADRPLVSLSLALNYAISGLNVWSYHLFNLAIHLLAALTLFGVVAGTLQTPRFPGMSRDSARAFGFVVALLWVLHPLQTASVTYVYQRAESMMGLFYLLTFYCVIRGSVAKRPWPWYMAAVVACMLGMSSKAVMITAPVLVLIYDRVFLSGSMAESFRRRWALYAGLLGAVAVLGVTGIASLVLSPNPTERQNLTAGLGYMGSTPLEYALTQPGVILHYLKLSLWPHPLCLDYAWPLAKTTQAIALPLALVGALLVGTIMSFWRWPPLGFAGAWFFIVLAPTSSVIPIADAAFEHRMYLPLAAVIVVVSVAVQRLLGRVGAALRLSHAARRAVLVATVLLVAGAYGAVTARRQQDYLSPIAMWAEVVKQRPANPRAHNNLGVVLALEGRIEEAIPHYREAIRVGDSADVSYIQAHYNLGLALAAQGKFDEAISCYREAIRLEDKYVDARVALALALARTGRLEEGIQQLRRVLELDPQNTVARYNLALLLQGSGGFDEALAHYREAIRLDDEFVAARAALGVALGRTGRLEEGIEQLRRVLELDPQNAVARSNLPWMLRDSGRATAPGTSMGQLKATHSK
jgi:protein O-mannosyl-transferase